MNVHVAPFSLHFACSDGCIGSRRCVFRTRSMSVMRLFRVLLLCLGALGSGLALAQAVSFTSAGAYSYTVPSGVTRLRVEVGGGGGGGGGREGSNNGSRGGAGHVLWTILNVSPGQVVSGVVAGGGGAGQGPVTGTGGGTAGSGAASGGAGGNAGGSGSSGSGGGGGGASSVLLAGNLVMVAAGGSGGGGAGSVGSSVQGMPATVLTLAATCSVSPGSAGGTSSSDGGGGGGGGAGFAAGAGGPWHADSVNATTPATEGTSCALTTPSLFAVALRSGQGLNFGTTSSTLPPTAGGSGYVILQPDNYSSVFSPGAYSYTVPNGVYRLAYLVEGAGGGHGGYDLSIPGGSGSGGLQAYGVLNVQPGQVVSGVVGSKGSAGTSDVTGAGAGAGGSGAANGGSGGNAGSTGASGGGGGGGGASSMALGGNLVLLAAGGPGGQGGATASDPQRSNPPSSITGASSCLPTNGQAGAAMAGDGGGGGGGGGGNSAAAAGGTGHADGTYSGAAASAGSSCYVNNVGATGIFMAAPTAASNWNGTGMAVLGPAPSADLVVSKSDARTSVQIGDVTTYTLTVSNLTGSAYEGAITGAILSDPAVSGLSKQAVACSSTPGQCVSPPTVAQLQAGTFALPALNPGDTYELLVMVLVDNSARGTITNTASVSHLAGNSSYINGLGCTNPASGGLSRSYQYSAGVGTCTASDTNTVLTLQGSMTAPGHFTALNSDNYTFTVSNKSSAATSGQINIVIQLPAGLRANGGAAGTVVAGRQCHCLQFQRSCGRGQPEREQLQHGGRRVFGHADGHRGGQLCHHGQHGWQRFGRQQPGQCGVCGRLTYSGGLTGDPQRRPQDGHQWCAGRQLFGHAEVDPGGLVHGDQPGWRRAGGQPLGGPGGGAVCRRAGGGGQLGDHHQPGRPTGRWLGHPHRDHHGAGRLRQCAGRCVDAVHLQPAGGGGQPERHHLQHGDHGGRCGQLFGDPEGEHAGHLHGVWQPGWPDCGQPGARSVCRVCGRGGHRGAHPERVGLCGAGAESGAAGCGVKRPQTASDIAGTRTAHAALRTSGCCLAV